MNTRLNRILFDFDGTLILHNKQNEGMEIATLLDIPIELQPEFSRRLQNFFSSSQNKKYFSRYRVTYELYLEALEGIMGPLTDFNVSPKQVVEAIDTKAKYYSILATGAVETLEYLKGKGYTMAVFTNGFYDMQMDILKYKGLDQYFYKLFAWDNFWAKPHKRAFERALDGTDPIYNVMIGDDPLNDIKPAKELGMLTVGINFRVKTTEKTKPQRMINKLTDLMKIL